MGTAVLPGLGQPGLSMPGTSLTSNPGMQQLEHGFNNNIYPMFGPASATPSVLAGTGSPNALTSGGVGNLAGTFNNNPGNTNQFYPNQSLLQTTAPNLLTGGSAALNAGLSTTGSALNTLQTPINFFQQLMSGNPATVTAALGPTAANIATIAAGATNRASQGMPEGGFRSLSMANEPFWQASQVGNAAEGLQATAAAGLEQASAQQAAIAAALEQTGLGLTQQGLGASQAAMTGANQKQQINQEAGSVFGDIMKALSVAGGIAGNVAGGFGGLLGGGDLSAASAQTNQDLLNQANMFSNAFYTFPG